MIRWTGAFLIVMATANLVFADWQLYKKDSRVIASVDYLSYESFRDQPSVVVRWHYRRPREGVAGLKIQFTADCRNHRLFEIASYPYDADGKYLMPPVKNYNSPIAYPVTPGSLNESTYKLLCH